MPKINFGKYFGKPISTELLLLRDPVYVAWVIGQGAVDGPLAPIQEEVIELMRRFDEMPLMAPFGN